MALSTSSANSACSALATLLGSDALFGAANANATNHSAALGAGLNNLASGTLVGKYAGMGATATSCGGLAVSASKLDVSDAGGSGIDAGGGGGSFLLPEGFGSLANLSADATVRGARGTEGELVHDTDRTILERQPTHKE